MSVGDLNGSSMLQMFGWDAFRPRGSHCDWWCGARSLSWGGDLNE